MKFTKIPDKFQTNNFANSLKSKKCPKFRYLAGGTRSYKAAFFYQIWGVFCKGENLRNTPLFIDKQPYNGDSHTTTNLINNSVQFGQIPDKFQTNLCLELQDDPNNCGIWDFSSLFLKILRAPKPRTNENIGSKYQNKIPDTNVKKLSRANPKRTIGTVCSTGGEQ